jgi:hypothetical protein
MINYDQSAFEIHFVNDDRAAGVGGADLGADRGGIVQALVRALRPAVVDAPNSE